MSESASKRGVWVGFFVFIGVVILIAGILMVGNLHGTFTRKMKVLAIFDDVNGLQAGNNVWFSGVKIGTVSEIHFHNKSKVAVTVNIELKAQEYIRKDAKIKISTDGLIGNKILVIYGGSTSAGEVNIGDTLDVEVTFSSEDMLNMVQENNKNLLAITSDFKAISAQLAAGNGTIGKLLSDETLYENVLSSTASLDKASARMVQVMNSLGTFTRDLNKSGGLAHELVTDSTTFPAITASVFRLEQMVDTAAVFMNNLKEISGNPNTPVGVFLQNEQSGTQIKQVIDNLESSTYKLDEDLEALQHNFLFRRYFKKKAKKEAADKEAAKKE
jgi:phospholipid/cholesterol/gamma-HCH transport system substrate-binding protein